MEGANAYGSTSSNNFGGTISTYYDKNEGKKVKDEDKKKEKENLKDYEIENYSLISSSFECIGAPPECKYYRRIKAKN